MLTIGFDAKRIVRNGTGLGSYGRTLVNDIARLSPSLRLRLYAPDQGRDDLRRTAPCPSTKPSGATRASSRI